MSIRLRLSLLYSAILALMLVIFSVALYTIQSNFTLGSLKNDLRFSSEGLSQSIARIYARPEAEAPLSPRRPPPPVSFADLTDEQVFQQLPEREIVRVLDADGDLVASPFGDDVEVLPLSPDGLDALRRQETWWEMAMVAQERLLILNRPILTGGQVTQILQVARSLTERDRSLRALSATLAISTMLTTLAAFGIGWILSGLALEPIQRITQTADAIGRNSDFARRVAYAGPMDEVGKLAATFNTMLQRLQEAYQRVAESLDMQRSFVANVSHELRTPLTTVRGNLALLRRKPPLPNEERADILADLVDESDRLIRLVNNLLTLARADTQDGLQRESVPLRPLVDEVCRQVRQLDSGRQVEAVVSPVVALGDRDALKQILLILLDNALKHSDGSILLEATDTEGMIGIRVEDSGPGIAPDKLPHIFERFYRGDPDSRIPGVGLGLSIAKALVEGLGGTIWIESELGRGSKVHVRLPREPMA